MDKIIEHLSEQEWEAVRNGDWFDILGASSKSIAMTFQIGHAVRNEKDVLEWHLDPDLTVINARVLAAAPKLFMACATGFDFMTLGVNQLKEKYGPDFKQCDALVLMEEAMALVTEDTDDQPD